MLPPSLRRTDTDVSDAEPWHAQPAASGPPGLQPQLAELWADPAPIQSIDALMHDLCIAERSHGLGDLLWEHVSSGRQAPARAARARSR